MSLTDMHPHRPLAALFFAALVAVHAILPTYAAPSDVDGRKVKVPTPAVKSFTILPPFGAAVNGTSMPTATGTPGRQLTVDSQNAARAVATAHLTETLGFPASEFVIKSIVTTSSGVTAVYVRQLVNGLEVVNADVNINIKNGQIVAIGDSFYRGARPSQPDLIALSDAESTSGKLPADAFKALASFVGAPTPTTVNVMVPAPTTTGNASDRLSAPVFMITSEIAERPVPVHYNYVQNGNNLKLVYSLQLKQPLHWYHGHVNVQTGEVEAVNDWASAAWYPVIPVGEQSPDKGPVVVVDSAAVVLANASPKGWHYDTAQRTTTQGNNVKSRSNTEDPAKDVPPDGGANLDFTKYAPVFASANPNDYAAGSAVELFYLMNIAHDLTYQYGFNEASGNFQVDNGDKGGLGNDAIFAVAQDAESLNTAVFFTPVDGNSPELFMGLYTLTTPKRDSVFDLVIPHHEFFHGVSNRLTGGPVNPNCLASREAAGLGEGWSDMFALAVNVLDKQTVTRNTAAPIAPYIAGTPSGLRTFPYTSDMQMNPSTYSLLGTEQYQQVHKIGEVWASMLWEVYWNLVDTYGCGPIEQANLAHGNALWLQLIMDGLKIQTCNPNFVSARDAILTAEVVRTNGAINCLIWRGFAKRGLGTAAVPGVFVDSFTVPPQCM
ncbi:Fungalysin/Thermolysin Extracellular metalloproteinase 5 [Allomyces arbusculus]|nr:Fungalysin/Thermolysin Extracellular metalloproteinase 5 [Allomyces arbusculus]